MPVSNDCPDRLRLQTRVFNRLRAWLFQNSFMEHQLYQIVQGKPVDQLLAKLLPNHYQYPLQSLRRVNRSGIHYELDLSDLMDWSTFYGFYERSIDHLLGSIDEGATVIDVGSNIGHLLLAMAQKVNSNGRVIGFEPDPYLYEKCQKNLTLNGFQNVQIYPWGLGEADGRAEIRVRDTRNLGKNQIELESIGDDFIKDGIKIFALDSIVGTFNLTRLDLIKIDVEGFELKVLQGAKMTLQQWHPCLFIEVDDGNLREQGDSATALIGFLEELGYQVTNAATGAIVSSQQNFHSCHFDILAEIRGTTHRTELGEV